VRWRGTRREKYCHAFCILQDKDEQTRLEMKHRKEEDDLYRKFARQREEEDKRMKDEIKASFVFVYINIVLFLRMEAATARCNYLASGTGRARLVVIDI